VSASPRLSARPEVSARCLLAVTCFGLFAAIGTWFAPVDPPVAGVFPNHFVATLPVGNASGTSRLYYDVGAGFNPLLSMPGTPAVSSPTSRISFPLPAGTIVGLRVEPGANSARPTLAQIVDVRGRVLQTFETSDFRSEGRLALRRPLHLPGDPGHPAPVVRRERIIAALLALTEIGLLFFLWHSRFRRPLPRGLVAGSIVLAAACILFSRRPDVFAQPQFWSEDGTIYFSQRGDGWRGLIEPQANYLAILPRVTAFVANTAPVWYAPLIYCGVSIAVVLMAVLKAASPRVGLPLAPWAALMIVLVPGMDEITGNLTNAQWFGAVILVLVALSQPPKTWGEKISDLIAIALFGLTGPFVVAAGPIFVWRAVRSRERWTWIAAGLAAGAMAAELLTYRASSSGPLPQASASLLTFVGATGYRTGGQLFGMMPSPDFSDPVRWGIAGLLALVFIWCFFPLRAAQGSVRWALAWMATLVVVGGCVRYLAYAHFFFEPVFILRYFYLPVLFTGWILLAGLAQSGARRWIATLLLVLAAVRNTRSYRMAPYTDLHWPHYASAIQRGEPISVPINPPAWGFLSAGKR
jgi:hypothetical protein